MVKVLKGNKRRSKGKKNNNVLFSLLMAAGGLFVVSSMMVFFSATTPSGKAVIVGETAEKKRTMSALTHKLAGLQECRIASTPTERAFPWDTKPIWFAEFPDSFAPALLRDLIKQLTGVALGGKVYTSRTKYQKKCLTEKSETVACFTVHPIIELKPPPEEVTKSQKYGHAIVLLIRNPATAIPMHDNAKAVKFHDHPKDTQVSKQAWKSFRDQYVESTLQSWSTFYRHWLSVSHNATNTLGEYDDQHEQHPERFFLLSYERLMEARTGPGVLRRLAALLRQEGFPTVSDDDMNCVWYTSIGPQALQNYHDYKYDYSDYLPSYTGTQKSQLLSALTTMQQERPNATGAMRNENDFVFDALLQEYYNDISDNTITDK